MDREAALSQSEIQIEQQKLQLKAQEIQLKDRTSNKELDIRASKQQQNVMTDMMKLEQQREDPDLMEVLGQGFAEQQDEPLAEEPLQGENNESAETEQAGSPGDQPTGTELE